jgi:hypothetical protein
MQNRLDAAREARAASEKQLAELQAAIAAERAARPESVSFSVLPPTFFFFPFILTHAGSTRYGTGPTCHGKEDAD